VQTNEVDTFKRVINRQIPRRKDDMAKDDAGPMSLAERVAKERAYAFLQRPVAINGQNAELNGKKRQIICNGLPKRGSPCPNNLAFSLANWVTFYKMSAFGGIVAYLRSTFRNAMAPKASEETKSKAGSKVAAKTR